MLNQDIELSDEILTSWNDTSTISQLVRAPCPLPLNNKQELEQVRDYLSRNGVLAEYMLSQPLTGFIGKRLRKSLFSNEDMTKRWKITVLPGKNDRKSQPLQLSLNLSQVQDLLEGLWCGSSMSSVFAAFPGLRKIYNGYENNEKKAIQKQISSLEVPSSGLQIRLDPSGSSSGFYHSSNSVGFSAIVGTWHNAKPERTAARPALLTSNTEKGIGWLCNTYCKFKLQKVPFRLSEFTKNVSGMLHCTHDATVYLMLIPEVTKKTGSQLEVQTPEGLLAVKLVESAKGARRLLQEATALMALQSTGRVAELWNPECLKLHLEHGILTTIYHPTLLENNSFKWMSLAETEETLYQLLQVLSVVHESG